MFAVEKATEFLPIKLYQCPIAEATVTRRSNDFEEIEFPKERPRTRSIIELDNSVVTSYELPTYPQSQQQMPMPQLMSAYPSAPVAQAMP